MPYCYDEAEEYVRSVLDRLGESSRPRDPMLYATAKKVGFDKVIESLICPEGLLWVNYKKRGRYTLSPDELRHAINHVRNNIMMEATQRLAPPYI